MRTRILAGLTVVLAAAVLLLPLPAITSAPAEHHVQLDARMFAFEPGRLRVNQGDRVTVTLHATDVVHGLYIDGYGIDIIAEPGRPVQATFTADKLGKFRYRCSVSCGAMHPFMIGELIVGPNLPFWRAAAALLIVAVGSVVTLSVTRNP